MLRLLAIALIIVTTNANAAYEAVAPSGYRYGIVGGLQQNKSGTFDANWPCSLYSQSCTASCTAYTATHSTCTYQLNGGGTSYGWGTNEKHCPAGYALTGPASVTGQSLHASCFKQVAQCPPGTVLEGEVCVVAKCTEKKTVGQGFFDMGTSAGGSFPSVVCAGGCLAAFDGSAPAASRLDKGVRRYYAQGAFTTLGNGNSDVCTADNMPSGTASPPADSCPAGQVKFTVNGNAGCASTGGEVTTPPPQKTTTTTNTTNPNGSTTQTSTTVDTGTGQTTSTSTTYPAGTTPPPPGTKVEPSDAGKGDNDAHCGAAGQPPCKIDETGTPTDGDLSEQHQAFDQAAQARVDAITAIGSQQVTELPWLWNPQFPTGSCTALDISLPGDRGGVLDWCSSPVIAGMRSILSWVYFMMFAWYSWTRFTNNVGAK
jgi:hypothetical protein